MSFDLLTVLREPRRSHPDPDPAVRRHTTRDLAHDLPETPARQVQ